MPNSDQVKAALTALADGEDDSDEGGSTQLADRDDTVAGRMPTDGMDDDAGYWTVIERAVRATNDLGEAVAFVEAFGVGRLEAAVDQAEHEVSGLADEGRAALRAFQQYRDAAAGTDAEA
ncbi:hypothetical protein [Haloarcula amylolytica]|uniref:hypothetical protein n=1 Tax=Haloarcula amylolytica TaxID=396317 RepID=UPI003C732563